MSLGEYSVLEYCTVSVRDNTPKAAKRESDLEFTGQPDQPSRSLPELDHGLETSPFFLRLYIGTLLRNFKWNLFYLQDDVHMLNRYIDRIDRIVEVFDILRGFGVLSSPEAAPRDDIHLHRKA